MISVPDSLRWAAKSFEQQSKVRMRYQSAFIKKTNFNVEWRFQDIKYLLTLSVVLCNFFL